MSGHAVKPDHAQPGAECYCGDCLSVLPHLPSASVDAVISDPPYPEIDRPYGRLTEAEWHGMMRTLVPEVRRVLKPSGSAVFVLQPNSRKVGSMRPWLWQFMAWVCEDWNMVQDAWWWNHAAMPTVHANGSHGLMRPSLKACVWAGSPECFRDQDSVLWGEAEGSAAQRAAGRFAKKTWASGHSRDTRKIHDAAVRRGGVTPFNVLPIGNSKLPGQSGHGAGTPKTLCSWWVRYISPVGGVVLDPFQGSGTVGLAALSLGRRYVGIEREPDYHAIAVRRLAEAAGPLFANHGTVDFDSPPPAPEPTLFPI
jgi:DNA modification methylase